MDVFWVVSRVVGMFFLGFVNGLGDLLGEFWLF